MNDASAPRHLPDRGASAGDDVRIQPWMTLPRGPHPPGGRRGSFATSRTRRPLRPSGLPVGNIVGHAADPRAPSRRGAAGDELANLPLPESLPRGVRAPRRGRHVRRHRVVREGPDEEPPHRRRRHARAGARRGVRRRHGVVINFNTVWTSIFEPLPTFGFLDRLGTRVDVGGAPRPAVPRRRLRRLRASCCASARPCATGSPATGSRSTATTSTTRTPRPTTTRCSPPTSASGASRRTSAGSPTCRSSRPTS